MNTTTKLRMKNMIFYGYHGVFSAEKELGQRIEVDLELNGDFTQAGRTDDLDLAINYIDLYTIVKDIVEEGEYNLIEGIALAIVDQICDSFDLEEVIVRVRKPQPPLGGILEAAEFEVSKKR